MTGTPSPSISVIIPVYNDRRRLERCLAALSVQTVPRAQFEVIVVDNGSDEDISSLCEAYPFVRTLREERPGSYSARNAGLRVARGRLLAFTDSDCVPRRDWLERASAHFPVGDEKVGVGGRIQLFFKNPRRLTSVELYERVTAFPQEHYVMTGFAATANMMTTHTAFDLAGEFNAELKSGGDAEWGHRATASGVRWVYDPDVVVEHPARRSLDEILQKTLRVAPGVYHLRQGGRGAPWQERGMIRYFYPPRTKMLYCANHPELHGLSQKTRVIAVLVLRHYVFLYGELRAWLGRKPLR